MTLEEMIDRLNDDLAREHAHWHLYVNAAILVRGLHREELSEFFEEQAKDEMNHIIQFGKLILGLGGNPYVEHRGDFNISGSHPETLLREALHMEEQVVANYVQRQDDADELEKNGGTDRVHGRYISIFLDEQILDSRSTADHLREMLKGN